MKAHRFAAALAAAAIAVCTAFSAFAEPEAHESSESGSDSVSSADESEQPDPAETSASETQAVTQAPVTYTTPETTTAQQTWQTATQTTAATVSTETQTTTNRVIKPAQVFLNIGEIKDDEFDVTLNITPDQLISSAVIKVEYDSSLMEMTGSLINSGAIGGQPSEEITDGCYTLNYINTKGTDFIGTYSTMHFKITDKKMTSSVIYVSVEKLEDTDLLDIPNNIQNGIVKYQDEVPAEESKPDESQDESSRELPVINVKLGSLPMMLSELNVPDSKNVKSVKIIDAKLAVYEQGALSLLESGETEMVVKYNSGKELRFKLVIAPADTVSSAAEVSSTAEVKENTTGRTFMIALAVLAAAAAVAIEYILIMKPFGKKNANAYDEEEAEQEYEEYDEDDETEMVQNPEEVFARRKKPKPSGGNKPDKPAKK